MRKIKCWPGSEHNYCSNVCWGRAGDFPAYLCSSSCSLVAKRLTAGMSENRSREEERAGCQDESVAFVCCNESWDIKDDRSKGEHSDDTRRGGWRRTDTKENVPMSLIISSSQTGADRGLNLTRTKAIFTPLNIEQRDERGKFRCHNMMPRWWRKCEKNKTRGGSL